MQPSSIKKPYVTPRLIIYGTLTSTTLNVNSSSGKNDHVGGPTKTS
jgi:hypothetical protein